MRQKIKGKISWNWKHICFVNEWLDLIHKLFLSRTMFCLLLIILLFPVRLSSINEKVDAAVERFADKRWTLPFLFRLFLFVCLRGCRRRPAKPGMVPRVLCLNPVWSSEWRGEPASCSPLCEWHIYDAAAGMTRKSSGLQRVPMPLAMLWFFYFLVSWLC